METPRGIRSTCSLDTPHVLVGAIPRIAEAFQSRKDGEQLGPERALEGLSGTYFLKDAQGVRIAVYKPRDEEPHMPFNPKGHAHPTGTSSSSFWPGVLAGENTRREVAAYMIDSNYGHFANVPYTTLVEAVHPRFSNGPSGPHWKDGSLQQCIMCIHNFGSLFGFSDLPADFNPPFPDEDVQRIAAFDILIVNSDRSPSNLLVLDNAPTPDPIHSPPRAPPHDANPPDSRPFVLVPIDHGLVLPDSRGLQVLLESLVWHKWQQVKQPIAPVVLEFINSLDAERDARMLREKLAIRNECLRTLKVTALLLQVCAAHRLNLFQIASIFTRRCVDPDTPSVFEGLINDAIADAVSNSPSGTHVDIGGCTATADGQAEKEKEPLEGQDAEGSGCWTIAAPDGEMKPTWWTRELERRFLKALHVRLVQCIVGEHPDWRSYPFHREGAGQSLEQRLHVHVTI